MITLFKERIKEPPRYDAQKKDYAEFMSVIRRELANIRSSNEWRKEVSEEDIKNLQMLYLAGLKKVFLNDIFYDHIIAQIDDGDTDRTPDIYPQAALERLERSQTEESVTGKCILMSYRKSYSIANQIRRLTFSHHLG